MRCLVSLALALSAALQEPAVELPESEDRTPPPVAPAATAGEGAAESRASPPARYRSLAEAEQVVERWVREHPDRARRLVLAREPRGSAGDPEVSDEAWPPVVELFAPGPVDPAERPTLVVAGGLDGSSLAGAEACLWIGESLLAGPGALPSDVCVVLVPWASPGGLARALADAGGPPAVDDAPRPIDDDRDGAFDEDGPDDVDGDGEILHMLVEDPGGEWTRDADPRFLAPARAGDAPRFRLSREGRDDDGDGAFNEDGAGGVALDRNFPLGWTGADGRAGPWPLSEPAARGLAELVLARRTFAVVLLQGTHGRLAIPGGLPAGSPGAAEAARVAERDLPAFERVQRHFLAATGRPPAELATLAEVRGAAVPGAAIDWIYGVGGALAVEVAPWGVEAPSAPGRALAGTFDRAWSEWLDDARGGIGFVDWHPVELGSAASAWVGGWRPLTFRNPPPDLLPAAIGGLDGLARGLLADAPRLEVEVVSTQRDGGLCEVTAFVRNRGGLPSGISPRSSCRLRLELPADARLLAGEAQVALGHLPGGAASAERRWLVAAPRGGVFLLHASDDWTVPVVRDLRP